MPLTSTTFSIKHCIHFDCPCGYVYEKPIKDERRLKIIAKLHKKICSMCGDIGEVNNMPKLKGKVFKEACKKAIVL